MGNGTVFLFFRFFFKSPALPALAIFGWESIRFLLPPLLKKASVIHYLQSLFPVPMSEGPFAMLADTPMVRGFAALIIFVAALKIRRIEITYEEE